MVCWTKVSWVLVCVFATACDDQPALTPPPPVPLTPPRREVAAPRAVTTPAAFDLVVGPRGPLLVYAEPATVGGAIQVVALDRTGATQGEPRPVSRPEGGNEPYSPDALELAAASAGGTLAVAWVERHGTLFRVLATHGSPQGAFAPPASLGATERELSGTRGHVAVAVSPAGHVDVMARLGGVPCRERPGATSCSSVTITRLAPGPSERRGVGLLLPLPCAQTLLGFVHASDVWHYAVCDASEGAPATTLYAVQFEPQYAHAERALEGCTGRGVVAFGGGAAVVGDCEGSRRGLWLGEAGRSRRHFEGVARVECDSEGARMRLPDGTSEVLSTPRAGLAALLEDEVAPPGSRAVWSGEALLVAAPIEREVGIRRFECWNGTFRRTDHE